MVHPSTYESSCDTSCQPFTGEHLTGTAEPGMPIEVRNGAGVLGRVVTDDGGQWALDVTLPNGRYAVTATALGPDGHATSAARAFSVS